MLRGRRRSPGQSPPPSPVPGPSPRAAGHYRDRQWPLSTWHDWPSQSGCDRRDRVTKHLRAAMPAAWRRWSMLSRGRRHSHRDRSGSPCVELHLRVGQMGNGRLEIVRLACGSSARSSAIPSSAWIFHRLGCAFKAARRLIAPRSRLESRATLPSCLAPRRWQDRGRPPVSARRLPIRFSAPINSASQD